MKIENHDADKLADAITLLAHTLHHNNNQQMLDCILAVERKIMSAISDFATKQTEFNTRQAAAIDGLVGDVQTLNDKITELQNSSGAITPEDQALLDGISTASQALTEKMEALDSQTPPRPPVVV